MLEKAKQCLLDCLNTENEDGVFNFVYPMTTENIKGYLKYIDNFSKVLCVASSGDHLLNCVAKGARDITIFDVNPITYYLNKLKIAALHLSRGAFIKFFTVDESWDKHSVGFFNYTDYTNIRRYLDKDTSTFWDFFYSEIKKRNLTPQKSRLFRHMRHSRGTIVDANLYLDSDVYENMLKMMDAINFEFICADVRELEMLEHQDKYNVILLSNISDYISKMWGYAEDDANILAVWDAFASRLGNKYGRYGCQVFYAYVYQAGSGPGWTNIDKLWLIPFYFHDYKSKCIPGFSRAYNNDNSIVDCVFWKEVSF